MLILTEKPSVAQAFADALGGFQKSKENGWLYRGDADCIVAAHGHLLELFMPEDYNPNLKKWTLDTLPIIPNQMRYKPIPDPKTNSLKVIGQALKTFGHDNFILATDAEREGELIAILDSIRRVISRGHEASPLESLCRLTDLLLFVGDAAKLPSRGHDSDSGYEHSPEIIHKVIRYVRDNYRTISGISEIADHFYINKDYLTRVFRKFTGFTVHDYIRSVRISKSRVMLGGGSGVTEAAFACGFNSTSYFIRVFTKAVGVTPAQYRRSVNGETLSE